MIHYIHYVVFEDHQVLRVPRYEDVSTARVSSAWKTMLNFPMALISRPVTNIVSFLN